MLPTTSRPRSARPHLATWLFLSAFASTIAAVVACTLLIDRSVEQHARADARAFLQAHADAFRYALDRGMARNVDEVQLISQSDEIAGVADPAATRHALDRLHARFPDFAWMGVVGLDGKVIAASDGLLTNRDVSARPWFSGARDHPYVGDVHRAVLLEQLL
ncbi:MAG TPA: hypothetical protein VH328_09145, partial [Burkholderiaceae bacterium]|nr:hypothetical protein [Burkholderiaceae bacterium]